MAKRDRLDTPASHIAMPPGYGESYVKMTQDRSIFLVEDVSIPLGIELSALLLYYDSQSHDEVINLYIHTDGGDTAGLANIYDVMQMIHAPIKTIVLGKAYSAGAWILAAGTKGKRYAMRSSKVMIHGAQFVFPIRGGDYTDSKNYLSFVDKKNDALLRIMARHTSQTFEKVKADCQSEHWMDAKDAMEYGIVDHII